MNAISSEKLKRRKNLQLVYMRSSYRNGHFVITETVYPIEKINRVNLRYNEVFDYRISHLNTVIADKIAYGCYEVYVLSVMMIIAMLLSIDTSLRQVPLLI